MARVMKASQDVLQWQTSKLGTPSPWWVGDRLLPLTGTARHARDVVSMACIQWQMTHLLGQACLVVSELVTNALDHAQTMVDLRVVCGRRHLMIGVYDGSPTLPPRSTHNTTTGSGRRGYGLIIVALAADRWGYRHIDGGKVVWAALRHDTPGFPTGSNPAPW